MENTNVDFIKKTCSIWFPNVDFIKKNIQNMISKVELHAQSNGAVRKIKVLETQSLKHSRKKVERKRWKKLDKKEKRVQLALETFLPLPLFYSFHSTLCPRMHQASSFENLTSGFVYWP